MFKKLKRKFVISNMLLISVVLMGAFTFIYAITFSNVQKQNDLKLDNISAVTMRYMELFRDEKNIIAQHAEVALIESFGIVVDSTGEPVFDSTLGMLSSELLIGAVDQTAHQDGATGTVILEGRHFRYKTTQVAAFVSIGDDNAAQVPIQHMYHIAFLDTDASKRILSQLLITFLLTGTLTLLAIFGISIHFANRAVVPIEASYMKQKQFIQDASHELKTPLSTIRTNLEVITASPKEPVEMLQKWFGFITYEVDRMSKLVNDLLYLAKTESTETEKPLSLINLSDTVEYAAVAIESKLFERNISFQQDIEPQVLVMVDPEKMAQVVNILLDNAVKYTDSGGTIKLQLIKSKSGAELSVFNTGRGISKDHIPHIFDRFYRGDESRKHDGSYGLGLAIAKSLVEGMKGSIDVISEPGIKTIFIVKLG